eukprot:5384760-Amphidinium_carterae.2
MDTTTALTTPRTLQTGTTNGTMTSTKRTWFTGLEATTTHANLSKLHFDQRGRANKTRNH